MLRTLLAPRLSSVVARRRAKVHAGPHNALQSVRVEFSQQMGRGAQPGPIAVQSRTWFNEDLESRAFILPGVLALVMSVIGAFLTSLTIAREWERGTMEQLVSTPVTPLEILLGKLVPYFVMGMLAATVCTLVAIYWFEVPFRGSVLTLLVSTALFLVVVLALGFFVSVVAKNQLAVPDCTAGGASAGVSAVGISVCHRPDAARHSGRYLDCASALLHDGSEEHFSEGHAGLDALSRTDTPGVVFCRARAGSDARHSQASGLRR